MSVTTHMLRAERGGQPMEQYIGVDLHKAFFQVCVVDGLGARCWEDRFPRTEGGVAAFLERTDARAHVAVEASGPTWSFADRLSERLADVQIVDAGKTRLKAGYAAKTDRLDARRLADALRRDSVATVYYPPPEVRDLRELCRYRISVVRTRSGRFDQALAEQERVNPLLAPIHL
jgi:transposase